MHAMAEKGRRREHVYGQDRLIVVQSDPGSEDWYIKHMDRSWNSGPAARISGLPKMVYSKTDCRWRDRRFAAADAAISFALFMVVCDWFAYQIHRLCATIPSDAGIFRAALAHASAARPQTMEEVRMRAVSMTQSLSIWGESMFPQEKSLAEVATLLE
jgi:hypothetical protein